MSFLRGERRRQFREQEAYMQSILDESDDASDWKKMSPLLDEAISRLRKGDRDALVLRFFKEKKMSEVAAILKVSEAAAQSRVHRAAEKLRRILTKRGVAVPAAVLAAVISAYSVQAAPPALAKVVTTAAVVKGAGLSGSTLTLFKGALKLMAWTQAKTPVVTGVVILLLAGTTTVGIHEFRERENPVRLQVLEIIRTHGDDPGAAAAMISKIGPPSLPALNQLISWKKSCWDFFGATDQQKLREQAVMIVNDMGPVAVRPLTSALCSVVNDPELNKISAGYANEGAVLNACSALLNWSVPGSPLAVATLTNWLSNPARQNFFGWGEDFRELPDAASLLTPWLKGRNIYINEIANQLALLGTNAVVAVPALIEVSRHGIDVTPPLLRLTNVTWDFPTGAKKPVMLLTPVRNLQMPSEQRTRNRSSALLALGNIGVASAEVNAVLEENLNDKDDLVRFAALKALYQLHLRPEKPLADLLYSFSPRRGTQFSDIIEWTGTLGSQGQEALPWLHRLTNYNYIRSLPEGVHADLGWDLAVSTETLRELAFLSICEIDPRQIDSRAIDRLTLLHLFSNHWETTKRLESESNAAPVLTTLRPLVTSSNTADAASAAYIVLGLFPGDTESLKTLQRCANDGELNHERLFAAKWLWEKTGEPGTLVEAAVRALKSPDTDIAMLAAQTLIDMGEAARPAIPVLKASLWDQDGYKRAFAAKALLKLSPEELPSIQ
jgi:hypothetical protein